MNEAALSERLRALREPAPRNGFEERLQQALWREAAELRAERAGDAEHAPRGARSLRRVRRWGGRFGLGVIIACGATAAAAAGGVWAALAHSQRPAPAPEALHAEQQRAREGFRGSAAQPPPAPSAIATPPSAAGPPSAFAPAEPARPRPSTSDARTRAPGSARAAAGRDKPGSSAGGRPARGEPAALLPFDLPERGSVERAPGADRAAPERPARPELQLPEPRGAAANPEGRALPGLPARGERRSRPDRSASERGAAPPGLEIARERASEKAERGLERAREARERK